MYYDFKRKTFFASVIFASLAFFALLPYIFYASLLFSGLNGGALGLAYIFLISMISFGVDFIVFELISIILSVICRVGADRVVYIYCMVNIVLGTILSVAVLCSCLIAFI